MIANVKRATRQLATKSHGVVLTYHSVLDQPAPFTIWHYLDRRQIEEQFVQLAKRCNCISVADMLAGVGTGRLPANSVALTFDDGFANNLHIVLPMLERYRIPATFFIASGFMGANRLMWPEVAACVLVASPLAAFDFANQRFPIANPGEKAASYKVLTRYLKKVPSTRLQGELDELAKAAAVTESMVRELALARQLRMMSWDELKSLAASKWVEIGAHTVNHFRLSELSDAEAYDEMVQSKLQLESYVGPVKYFAYPYGGLDDYHDRHKKFAAEAGFTAAFSSEATCVLANTDPFAIPRLGVGGDGTAASIEYAATGGLALQNGLVRWA